MHYYVEKQVFSWRAKTLKFDALLRGKAGFLVMRQKGANLLHYYVEKQVFSWCTKTLTFDALLRGKAGFLMTCQKGVNLLHYYLESRFSRDAPKRFKFVALLRGNAGFLMMCQKLLSLMHYYVEKQVFSWRAKKMQICCISTWKSRFSRETICSFSIHSNGWFAVRLSSCWLMYYLSLLCSPKPLGQWKLSFMWSLLG